MTTANPMLRFLLLFSFALGSTNPMYLSDERVIWQCEAVGQSYSYRIESLELGTSGFNLEIYLGFNFDSANLQERLPITVAVNFGQAIHWSGLTSKGDPLSLRVFPGGSVRFEVELEQEPAIGRCVRHIEMN